MKIISRKSKAIGVAETWKTQFYLPMEKRWKKCMDVSGEIIYKKLIALGSDPSPEEVDDVIGHQGWTLTRCDECGKYGDFVIQLGEEPDYDTATVNICRDCLDKAMKLMRAIGGAYEL